MIDFCQVHWIPCWSLHPGMLSVAL